MGCVRSWGGSIHQRHTQKEVRRPSGQREKPSHRAAVTEAPADPTRGCSGAWRAFRWSPTEDPRLGHVFTY